MEGRKKEGEREGSIVKGARREWTHTRGGRRNEAAAGRPPCPAPVAWRARAGMAHIAATCNMIDDRHAATATTATTARKHAPVPPMNAHQRGRSKWGEME